MVAKLVIFNGNNAVIFLFFCLNFYLTLQAEL